MERNLNFLFPVRGRLTRWHCDISREGAREVVPLRVRARLQFWGKEKLHFCSSLLAFVFLGCLLNCNSFKVLVV